MDEYQLEHNPTPPLNLTPSPPWNIIVFDVNFDIKEVHGGE